MTIYGKSRYFLILVLLILITSDVIAIEEHPKDPFGSMMCDVVRVLHNWWAKIIAIIAIMVLGIRALSGKIRWDITLIIMTGVIILFSAEKIVGIIGNTDKVCSNCSGPTCPGGTK